MGSLRLSQSPMEVELRLDQKEAIYTSRDTVSGEVVLHTESPADLSTIVLTLSATATSRLTKSRRTETHTLFKKSQQLFPSDPLLKRSNRSSVTIGGGNHILRFSTTTANCMCKYGVLAQGEVTFAEEVSTLNRETRLTG
ncbi:hypothetical protein N7475_003896 [Penicillium sp. IBT 31633x]|nr:hypothetical protein N7475_003896 [Penicillium sp. IBT 31633x]